MRYVLALATLFPAIACAVESDRCAGRIPGSLQQPLVRKNPGFRLPREQDNLPEDVAYNLVQKGTGCLAVARADFTGDRVADYVVALPAVDSNSTRIVAAVRAGKGWRIEPLDQWPNSQGRVFISVEPAGRYTRTEALEGPASEPGEVLSMTCRYPVAIFGFTESSAVAYCRQPDGWRHVWVSD